MKQFVRKRYATAREQLENPGPRPALVRRSMEGPPPEFVAKVQRFQQAAEQFQRSGGDMRPIQKLMQQVGPHLQQGQLAEAAKLLDEATRLAEEGSRAPRK